VYGVDRDIFTFTVQTGLNNFMAAAADDDNNNGDDDDKFQM
jgi:hypothetical protein